MSWFYQPLLQAAANSPSNTPPTVALNTADATVSLDPTPTLLFTGTDAESEDIRYNIQIASQNTFSASGVDTYYINGHDELFSDPNSVFSDEVNATDGSTSTASTVSSVGSTSSNFLHIHGSNAPDNGDAISQVRARIYADANGIDSSMNAAIYTDGLGQLLGTATMSSATAGYGSYTTLTAPTGGWTWDKLQALEAKVYGTTNDLFTSSQIYVVELEVTYDEVVVDAVSGTDPGFSGSPDNTDPFTSAQQVSYTVQTDLAPGTYYWRVRGIDPSGSNTYGAWATTRSFTIPPLPLAEDFETGGLGTMDGLYTAGGGSVTYDSGSEIEGTYTAEVGGGASSVASIYKDLLTDFTEIYVQFKVKIPSGFAWNSATYMGLFNVASGSFSGTARLYLNVENYGALRLTLGGDISYTDTSINLTAGTEHTIEMYIKKSATVGQVKIWVDNNTEGSPDYDSGSSTNTGATAFRWLRYGNGFKDDAADAYFIDDLKADTAFIGFTGGTATLTTQDASWTFVSDATTINQDHVLSPNDASFLFVSDATSISQNHVIATNDTQFTFISDATTIVENHVLSTNDTQFTFVADATTISQNHSITANDSAFTFVADATTINQNHVLSPNDAQFTFIVDATTVNQEHVVTPSDTLFTFVADASTIAQNHVITPQDAQFTFISDNSTITQIQIIQTQDAAFIFVADSATVSEETSTLQTQNSFWQFISDATTITQDHLLTTNDAQFTFISDATTIDQITVLQTNDASFNFMADSTTLDVQYTLSTQDGFWGFVADVATITQVHDIVSSDTQFTFVSDATTVDEIVNLSVQDAQFTFITESTTINQNHVIETTDTFLQFIASATSIIENFTVSPSDAYWVFTADTTTVDGVAELQTANTQFSFFADNSTLNQNHIIDSIEAFWSFITDTTTIRENPPFLEVGDESSSGTWVVGTEPSGSMTVGNATGSATWVVGNNAGAGTMTVGDDATTSTITPGNVV